MKLAHPAIHNILQRLRNLFKRKEFAFLARYQL